MGDKANWTGDCFQLLFLKLTIPDVTNQPVISSAVSITSLTIDRICRHYSSSGSLTVSGAIDNNGTLNIGNANSECRW